VTQFLTMLANERRVSVSTHNQALSALLFLYRNVLGVNLPWLTEVQRPTRPRRIPSALTTTEVAALLSTMNGDKALLAKLLYGPGMGLMEDSRLRVKDVNFDRQFWWYVRPKAVQPARWMRSAACCDECRLTLHTNHRKYRCS
jgi:site-specific recombinase XerD